MHVADANCGMLNDAVWGRQGGPITRSSGPQEHRWTFSTGALSEAQCTTQDIDVPENMVSPSYWSAYNSYGDLPFDNITFASYTSSQSPYPGELLLYDGSLASFSARIHANGFYSAVGIEAGSQQRLIYSGLSPLSAQSSTIGDSGLYGVDYCGGSFVEQGGCLAATKLLSWEGSSGPVTADTDGNVFAAAFETSADPDNVLYALTEAQALQSIELSLQPLAAVTSGGTTTVAATAPTASQPGWVLAKGWDFSSVSPAYAVPYEVQGSGVVGAGGVGAGSHRGAGRMPSCSRC